MNESPDQGGRLNLLFVCTGNTCRSPMAEAIARRAVEERGWGDVEVRSAGVGATDGAPASEGAIRASARSGLDLTGHRSTFLTPALAEWATLILVMSPGHLLRLTELGAGAHAAVLTAYAAGVAGPDVPADVSDPFGGSDEEYVETFDLLARLIGRALQRLQPAVAE